MEGILNTWVLFDLWNVLPLLNPNASFKDGSNITLFEKAFLFYLFWAALQHMEFPGQGSELSHSCGNTRTLNPLCQTGD